MAPNVGADSIDFNLVSSNLLIFQLIQAYQMQICASLVVPEYFAMNLL